MAIELEEIGTALTIEQLAETLHIGERTARQWVKDGEIESIRIGRKYIVTQRMLTDYLERNRTKRKKSA